jgi:type VI secretion system secreted protein VgrG
VDFEDAAPAVDGRSWLVLEVRHTAQQANYKAGEDAAFTYENGFTLVPADVPWHPPRSTPRPRVHGTQSALVVGVAGEEISTDAQGRVKLHFYWDRYSARNLNSSCWVRCSAAIAGNGWGHLAVPRIGQEVLVDFLEGDPDRPVVVGRVYNGERPPPCDPGRNGGVVSGMRSKTHKGSGYNALTMDDTTGKELISIHAQYDMDTVVEHDERVRIGHDRTETVGHDETITIGANRTERVGASETGSVGTTRTWQVGTNDSLTVGGARTETVAQMSTETVGAVKALTIGAAYQISVGGVLNATVGGAMIEEIGAFRTILVAKKFSLEAGDEIVLKTGSASITLKKNGDIIVKGNKISITGSGDVVVKGSKIGAN